MSGNDVPDPTGEALSKVLSLNKKLTKANEELERDNLHLRNATAIAVGAVGAVTRGTGRYEPMTDKMSARDESFYDAGVEFAALKIAALEAVIAANVVTALNIVTNAQSKAYVETAGSRIIELSQSAPHSELDAAIADARREERAQIIKEVRQNCTLSIEAYKKGTDFVIYAVADWIENPPEWVVAARR